MQKNEHNQKIANAHRKVQTSTTLNRRYVSRPDYSKGSSGNRIIKTQRIKIDDNSRIVGRSSQIKRFGREMPLEQTLYANKMSDDTEGGLSSNAFSPAMPKKSVQINVMSPKEKVVEIPQAHPLQVSASERTRMRTISSNTISKAMSAKEMKQQAIEKALASASRSVDSEQPKNKSIFSKSNREKKTRMQNYGKLRFGFGRVALALSCTAAAVFAIVYFVNLNMPDLSLKVAAMQTGIHATYPNYIPRDYILSDIVSENGKVTLNFKKSESEDVFTIVEESSSWDSNALMTNYVSDNFGEDYTVLREQGLTIYIDNSNACWVNGGILYKLSSTSGTLSKKQIKTIATSL